MTNRSSNGEIAALQVEMENTTAALKEFKDEVRAGFDKVNEKLDNRFVTKEEFKALKDTRWRDNLISTGIGGSFGAVITYFFSQFGHK